MIDSFYSIKRRLKPPSLNTIKRKEHLISFLEKRKERKLFLIHGRAGQGKSVLAADFLKSIDATFLWYRILEDDKDPLVLLGHLLEGIKESFYTDDNKIEDIKSIDDKSILEDRIQQIISILEKEIETNYYIVFDDFQIINSCKSCCEIFNYLVDCFPSSIHIIITSTVYPQLDIIRFRSEKELVDVSDKDLNFSYEEVRELSLENYEIDLNPKTLDMIMVITRGWITGITYLLEYASKLGIEEQTEFFNRFFRSKYLQSIDDFLREEVIEVLDPGLSGILILTSIFNEMTPEILDFFRESDGSKFFSEIKENNIFLEYESSKSQSFTYSPLFSSFLERMFMELPESERNAAHMLAGNYCLRKNQLEKAIHHFFKSNQKAQGEEIFIVFADKLLDTGEYEGIQELLKNFSKQEIVQNPLLSYYDGLVMNLIKPFSSRKNLLGLLPYFREKKDYLREARIYTELLSNYLFYLESEEPVTELTEMALEFLKYSDQTLPKEKRELLESLLTLSTWWIGTNIDQPYATALRTEETSYKFQNEEAFLSSRLALSRIYIYRGDFADSLNMLLKTKKIYDKYPAKHPYQAFIKFALGDSYFYLGKIDKAIRETKFAIENSNEDFAITRFLKLNLIFYYLYTEEYEQAEAIFESERIQDIGENLYLQYFWIYLLQMLIAYRNGNVRRAEYYCSRLMEKENNQILKMDYPFSYIALGEINIFIKNYDVAEKYLGHILNKTLEKDNPYVHATAFSLMAYLQHLKGDSGSANQYFEKMEIILKKQQYRNLDICNPELLKKIAEVSDFKIFGIFPRLKVIKDDFNLPEKREKYELEFKTLGVFRVIIKGKEVEQNALIRQKRVADLLKLLIVFRENGISKEIVYETFWARYSYKSARDNLNTVVYRLRKIFGEENDFISTDANIIKLKDGSSIIDVDLFKQHIASGLELEKKQDIEAALNYYIKAEILYKGDFLEAGLYLDFIRDERENLKNKYKQLLFTMIKLSLDIKQYKESMSWANKLIVFDSLCEPAYRLLMISSVFTGNGSEISRIYHKLNTTLMENYNINPDLKTEKLKNILLTKTIPTSESWRFETII